MLTIVVKGKELWDEKEQVFVKPDEDVVLEFEHSLVSLSKWESHYKKPFLTEDSKTQEEVLYYIRCMALRPDVPEEVFAGLELSHLAEINEYMNDPMTATFFNEPKTPGRPSAKIITNELIYYWMSGFGLPMEMQYWHLNRLFTQLKVCNLESQPPKKLSPGEAAARTRAINEANRKKYEGQG